METVEERKLRLLAEVYSQIQNVLIGKRCTGLFLNSKDLTETLERYRKEDEELDKEERKKCKTTTNTENL